MQVVVVFPLVPVTPTICSFSAGRPNQLAHISAQVRRVEAAQKLAGKPHIPLRDNDRCPGLRGLFSVGVAVLRGPLDAHEGPARLHPAGIAGDARDLPVQFGGQATPVPSSNCESFMGNHIPFAVRKAQIDSERACPASMGRRLYRISFCTIKVTLTTVPGGTVAPASTLCPEALASLESRPPPVSWIFKRAWPPPAWPESRSYR